MTAPESPNSKHSAFATELIEGFTNLRGGIDNEVDTYLDRVASAEKKHVRSAQMGKFTLEESAARAFYEVMIKPFLLKGNLDGSGSGKTFVPDEEYVNKFVSSLATNGATSQMYIRLLQSRPGMLPEDSRITYGTLELLRTWAVRAKVAQTTGVNYGVNIVDETTAFDHGDQLGFTSAALDESYEAMSLLLAQYDITNNLTISPFAHQTPFYRGETNQPELGAKYEGILSQNIRRTTDEIKVGSLSLSSIRAVMIQRLRHGDSFTTVGSNRDLSYLADFDPDDVTKTIHISESFNSALQMRPFVKDYIESEGREAEYPEFFCRNALVKWGITKKADRLSIQPNFKLFRGRSVTPGYALPVYSEDSKFQGLTYYSDQSDAFSYTVVRGSNGLPFALIKQ